MLHEYLHILSDPAHTLVEFTFVLIDYLLINFMGHRIVKHFHRDLKRRDTSHGHSRRDNDNLH